MVMAGGNLIGKVSYPELDSFFAFLLHSWKDRNEECIK
ncbi:hypothetical protein BLGI_4802 [Brevibacillus laterosporus GI-9]|nr:hypothetical protein BLGI_4802 [Brevibacillus laterosporus GI-9]